jgi:hypothetical protein
VSAAGNVPTSHNRVNVSKARLGIIGGVTCIAIWAVAALGFNAPGYVHLLLSVGLFLLIWGITVPVDESARLAEGKTRSNKTV